MEYRALVQTITVLLAKCINTNLCLIGRSLSLLYRVGFGHDNLGPRRVLAKCIIE